MQKIVIASHSRYPVEKKIIRQKVKEHLGVHKLTDDYEVHIIIVGDRQMTNLNKQFMKREGTTDVLSFPLINLERGQKQGISEWPNENGSDLLELGEIVISYPEARRQAMAKNLTLDIEINNLVKHGLEHLLGFHHD
jgi:probable rRNA maturation factor